MSEAPAETDEEMARRLQAEFDAESSDDDEEVGRQFSEGILRALDDLWNNRNFKVVDDSFSEDCVTKGTFGESAGKNEFKNLVLLPLFNAIPDLAYAANDVFFQGRRMANRFTLSGTHTGQDLFGISTSGKRLHFSGSMITHHGEDGRITEMHGFFDKQQVIDQLTGAQEIPRE